jgi:hypothetical protein
VITAVQDSEWGMQVLIIPKKDVQELEGFQFALAFDLNMGYCIQFG